MAVRPSETNVPTNAARHAEIRAVASRVNRERYYPESKCSPSAQEKSDKLPAAETTDRQRRVAELQGVGRAISAERYSR